jgi:hypothetical protein
LCNSSHSRVLGFMTTLPSIWRTFQCIGRYWNCGHERLHLLNCGKYILTTSFYVSLSIYRTDETAKNRYIFIVLATLNSGFNSFWDLCYDWGLRDTHTKYRFLRRDLGFRVAWMYYVAILIDITLRFTWILYVAIPQQLQHSAITSFGISVGEVCRRGVWSLFRIENEHCAQTRRSRTCGTLPNAFGYIPGSEPQDALSGSKATERGSGGLTNNPLVPTDAKPNQITRSVSPSFPAPVVCV